MRTERSTVLERLSMGYTFSRDREALSLVYILYFLILLFSFVLILIHTDGKKLLPVSYRYHVILLICVIELWLMRKRKIRLARILLLSILPFLLIILPPMAGVTDNEFFFWFPYVPITFSLGAQLILHNVRHRIALIITLAIYLLLGLFIDNILIFFSEGDEKIIPLVLENRFYYKLIPVCIYLFVNITIGLLFAENYRNEKIMEDQRKELVQAEKMASLGTLTSGIAHEINNPLNFISGSLHVFRTLQERYLKLESDISPEKEEIMDQISKVMDSAGEGVSRASDIIASMEFFAHPDVREKQEIDVRKLVSSALSRVESRLPHYVVLSKEIPQELGVWGHEQQLRLVLTHILRNAIDALESKQDKGQETIGVTAMEERHSGHSCSRISITNSGPAIPEKDLPRIFDPFFSSREAGKGVGLGMSLSYMIIKEHGGRIEVDNQEGRVRFDLLLPSKKGGRFCSDLPE